MALVASESVSIIETLIEEANKGEIDLEGLDTFWSFKTKVVRSHGSTDLKTKTSFRNCIVKQFLDTIIIKFTIKKCLLTILKT
jgi:hypothetical protein